MEEKHGYWKHVKVRDDSLMGGWRYLSACTCSVCGCPSNIEKEHCPECGAIMDEPEPEEAEDDEKKAPLSDEASAD